MNHLFYNTFEIEKTPYLFLCGDETLELLRTTLAREIAGQGKNVLLISDAPMAYPIEGQILVDIEAELLSQKIASDESQIYYICSEVKDNLLYPVSDSFCNKFIPHLTQNTRLIVTVEKRWPSVLNEGSIDKKYSFISAFGFGHFGQHLSAFFSEFEQEATHRFAEELKTQWKKWVMNFCPQTGAATQPFVQNLFFNQIKSLIDENRVIPIVRTLTDFYDKVFIGDINEYKLKEV